MRRHPRAIVALFLAAAGAWAQQGDRGLEVRVRTLAGEYAAAGKQYAVLIAIDRYRSWTALRNPVKDAREIRDILTRRYYVDEVIELYDADATKAGINRLFAGLIERTAPEDSVLIFYAGHGYLDPMSGTGFWIPVDGGTDKYGQENWLPNVQIRGFISPMKARHVALISDSCFSGDILNPTRGSPSDISSDYFRAAYQRVSRQVLTSGASESVPDNSPFAMQLKLALEGNRQPYLDPLMIYSEVRLGVSGSTPLFGALKEAGHQDGGSFLLFLRDPASVGPAPTVTVTASRAYGSIEVAVMTGGELYLEGTRQASVPAGGRARIDNVETGNRSLEMRYAGGERETRVVTVERDRLAAAAFGYVEGKAPFVDMVLVEGGTFQMGDTFGDGQTNEKPVHTVTVSSFYLGKYEVTQKQWQAVMGSNPSNSKRDDRPVEQVSWLDAVDFCNRLSVKEGLQPCYTIGGTSVSCDFSRNGYRLPTEAEWEYAAKGGRSSRGYTYAGGNDPGTVGWFSDNSESAAHAVGGKQANELGLHDMSGNVWEWCWDWYGSYSAGSQTDPRGPSSGQQRLLRGGSWDLGGSYLRSALRFWSEPGLRYTYSVGYRLARPRA